MEKAPTLWRLGHVLTTTNWQSLCGLNEATVEGAWVEGHGVWMVKSERATSGRGTEQGIRMGGLNWVEGRWDREWERGRASYMCKSRVESVESVELPYTQLCTD